MQPNSTRMFPNRKLNSWTHPHAPALIKAHGIYEKELGEMNISASIFLRTLLRTLSCGRYCRLWEVQGDFPKGTCNAVDWEKLFHFKKKEKQEHVQQGANDQVRNPQWAGVTRKGFIEGWRSFGRGSWKTVQIWVGGERMFKAGESECFGGGHGHGICPGDGKDIPSQTSHS